MATLDLDNNDAQYQIRAYQPGTIQINEQTFTHSVIVTPNQLIADWSPQSISDVDMAALSQIIGLAPDVLLIGTGEKLVFLPVEIYGELINRGIGVEVMDTRAACRTFNALAAEHRKVAAALVIK